MWLLLVTEVQCTSSWLSVCYKSLVRVVLPVVLARAKVSSAVERQTAADRIDTDGG